MTLPCGLFSLPLLCLVAAASMAEGWTSPCNVTVNISRCPARSDFQRVFITDAFLLGAVCNDRSEGFYYQRMTGSSKWIIYMEGGVGCGNLQKCNRRYQERPELMSSANYSADITGRDIFDPDPMINPDFCDYNMILLPYCTSDLWVGNSPWNSSLDEKFEFNSSATYNQFVFRGTTIFRTAVKELLEQGLHTAEHVSNSVHIVELSSYAHALGGARCNFPIPVYP